MLVAVPFVAVPVHGVLHRAFTFGPVEVVERDGRVRYAPFPGAFGGRQGRIGPVVHDVEASDAQVVIVMDEVLREIFHLVLHGHAESDVFFIVPGRERGCRVGVDGCLCILDG